MPLPRVIGLRRPRRTVAVLPGAALLLGVGAALVTTVSTPSPSDQSPVVAIDRTEERRACIDCRLEGVERAEPAPASAPTVAVAAPPSLPEQSSSQQPPPPLAEKSAPPPAASSKTPAPAPAPVPAPSATPPPGQTTSLFVTGYGQPDNDPPGPVIAYPGASPRHSRVGGVGSYADPVTVAVGSGRAGLNLVPGTRLYIPAFAKYGVVEDLCASCAGRWIDVFDGSSLRDNPAKVAACQARHTGTFAVEIDPPAGRPENVRPLYDRGACTP